MSEQKPVAIIFGAGPAGLTAAYELLIKTNIKPVIIEADKQVGGLSKTINYKNNLIDIGGHRFFSKSEKIIEWWLQFLPLDATKINISYQNKSAAIKIPKQNSFEGDSGKMMVRPRKSRIYYKNIFFDYPLRLNYKTLRNLGIIKTFKIAVSYFKAKLFPQRPELNLAQFFANRFGKELYETFFKGYTEKVWGVPCTSIPADWGHQRIKDLNIGKAIVHALSSFFLNNKSLTQRGTSTSLIEQFLYPQKGPGQMWETVANKIIELGGEIILSAKVESIIAESHEKISAVHYREISTGLVSTLRGDYFFSSMPVKELIAGMQQTDVPLAIKNLANGLEYRDFIVVGLLLKKNNGTNNNKKNDQLTDNWIYLQDNDVMAGRVQFFNNWSPFMVNDPDTIWMGVEYFCNETDELWNKKDEDIKQTAIVEMQSVGLINADDIIDGTVIKVLKAYPSYTGSYKNFKTLQKYLDNFENLFPIGRNGMHRYNNSDHSMMTAIVAVNNIAEDKKDKSNIWAVNMDLEYNEEI
jgi:protoporphyrinogen oxidase